MTLISMEMYDKKAVALLFEASYPKSTIHCDVQRYWNCSNIGIIIQPCTQQEYQAISVRQPRLWLNVCWALHMRYFHMQVIHGQLEQTLLFWDLNQRIWSHRSSLLPKIGGNLDFLYKYKPVSYIKRHNIHL